MLPPTFDILNIQTWKVKMSLYLKDLGIHVYLTIIKDSYFNNSKYLDANSKAIHALKSTLSDDYLCRVSNLDSAFVVWNSLISFGEQDCTMRGATRMLKVTLSTCATWSKGITPLR